MTRPYIGPSEGMTCNRCSHSKAVHLATPDGYVCRSCRCKRRYWR